MKKVLGVLAVLALLITGCSNQTESPVAPGASLEKKPGSSTIVEIALSDPNFSNLVKAVVLTDLAGVLSGVDQYTVFSPVNQAFEDLAVTLGYDDADELLVEENKELVKAVVLYHVAPGQRYTKNILAAGKTTTLAGQFAYIKIIGDSPYIGNDNGYAKIEGTDIRAKNGVIHVINKVLLPL